MGSPLILGDTFCQPSLTSRPSPGVSVLGLPFLVEFRGARTHKCHVGGPPSFGVLAPYAWAPEVAQLVGTVIDVLFEMPSRALGGPRCLEPPGRAGRETLEIF